MRQRVLIGLFGLCFWTGCGPHLPGGDDSVGPPESGCVLLPGAPSVGATLQLALTDPVDPRHAPIPRNDSEQLIFRHLYETLVRIDCTGRLHPGLAESWEATDGGTRWRFILRADARFTDGTPVRTRDIRHAWTTTRAGGALQGFFLPLAWIESVSEMDPDARVVTVRLAVAMKDPQIFAHPALAIHRPDPAGVWPLGTGPYSYETGSGQAGDPLTLVASARGPTLACVIHPAANPRDLIDADYDLLLVRDRTAIEYASHDPNRIIVPLPWDRLYLLVRATAPGAALPPVPPDLRADCADQIMAAQAEVRDKLSYAHSRGRDPRSCRDLPLPPLDAGLLQIDPGIAPVEPIEGHIAYCANDAEARRIAERLAALARQRPVGDRAPLLEWVFGSAINGFPQAAGLTADRLRQAQMAGEDLTYVLATDRTLVEACLDLQAVLTPNHTWSALPLVTTRASLIARPGLQGVWTTWDATPLFFGGGPLP